jgi:hypothetical protein
MPECDAAFDAALNALNAAVAEAAEFFLQCEPDLFDGYQTAAEVLAHLVFWHCEYVGIVQALRNDIQPELSVGTFAELNAAAAVGFACVPVENKVNQLVANHKTLARELRQISDLSVEIPIKQGGRTKSVRDRVPTIETHIHNHVRRLKSAERHGEAWVKAYYQEN